MNWNQISIWTLIGAGVAFIVVLLFLHPRRLPSLLQDVQRWLADDILRLFESPPFIDTAKSLFEASLFAGPTYYGIVNWISTQPTSSMAQGSQDNQVYLMVAFMVALVAIYACNRQLANLARSSGENLHR